MKKEKNKNSATRITISIIILLAIVFIGQAYVLPPQKVFGKNVISYLPLPAAFVNANAVLVGDYLQRIDVAQKIGKVDLNSASQSQILDQLINNKIAESLAAKNNLAVTADDVNQAYAYLQKTTQKQKIAEAYGLTEQQFKDQIVRPDVVNTKLAVWLAQNKGLNKDAYQKLDQAQKQLDSGTSFDQVAKSFSDDQKSSKIGGDLGFVGYTDVVPEIYQALQSTKDNKPHIIYSRFGIHIYEVTGSDDHGADGSKRYHLKHIFIKTADFNQWFSQQKNNYSIMKLI